MATTQAGSSQMAASRKKERKTEKMPCLHVLDLPSLQELDMVLNRQHQRAHAAIG